ncbi:MAG TPA: hypothetical protein VGE07_09035 [Herpetosiphonaceae bacterium]
MEDEEIGYPSFLPLFRSPPERGSPPYLAFLNITSSAPAALRGVVAALGRSPSPGDEIRALLDDLDWRAHLVGGMALIASLRRDGPALDALWRAFDEGSWVSPQLAAIASILDPRFADQARERILRRCQGVPDRSSDAGMLLRHTASGPNSFYHRECKALAALIAAARCLPELRVWAEEQGREPDARRMLRADPDRGGAIVSYWRPLCIGLCQDVIGELRRELARRRAAN